jgi:DeoR/GlpR family transcriptional regulator of sugar metabolism
MVNSIKRKIKILELLKAHDSVAVDQLTKLFDVSKVTVRGDLDDLERRGMLIRTHGGAVLPEDLSLVRKLSNTLEEKKPEKTAICKAALAFIKPGMNIIIDAGSTTVHLARMAANMNISVITNSIPAIQSLMNSPTVELFVAGGILRKPSLSLMGPAACLMLEQMHADILFLGTSGFSIEKGLTSTNIIEAETKKYMIKNSAMVCLLADSSKQDKMFLANICGWDSIDYFITDGLREDDRRRLAEWGVNTIIAGESS